MSSNHATREDSQRESAVGGLTPHVGMWTRSVVVNQTCRKMPEPLYQRLLRPRLATRTARTLLPVSLAIPVTSYLREGRDDDTEGAVPVNFSVNLYVIFPCQACDVEFF